MNVYILAESPDPFGQDVGDLGHLAGDGDDIDHQPARPSLCCEARDGRVQHADGLTPQRSENRQVASWQRGQADAYGGGMQIEGNPDERQRLGDIPIVLVAGLLMTGIHRVGIGIGAGAVERGRRARQRTEQRIVIQQGRGMAHEDLRRSAARDCCRARPRHVRAGLIRPRQVRPQRGEQRRLGIGDPDELVAGRVAVAPVDDGLTDAGQCAGRLVGGRQQHP